MSVITGTNRWAWVLAVCGVLLAPSGRSALACIIIGPTFEEALAEADVIFVGEVCGDFLVNRLVGQYGATHRIFGFRVLQSWKGLTEPGMIEITTPLLCGFDPPSAGDIFLVYGFRHPETGELGAHWASGTTEICDGISEPGLDDIMQFEPLGYFPLIADGPTTQEVLNICDADAVARQYLESDSCDLKLNLNHLFDFAPCGIGSLLPLGCIAMLFSTRQLVHRVGDLPRRRWPSCVLACVLLSQFAGEARACTCYPRSVEEYLERAEMVFVGEIFDEMLVEPHHRVIAFQVVQSWKGVEERSFLEVTMPENSGVCGPDHPELGDLFLVYAKRDPDSGELESNGCAGTGDICDVYEPKLRHLTEYDALGFGPLIADGPTTTELLNICENDPLSSPPAIDGPCGWGSLLPLGVGALLFALHLMAARVARHSERTQPGSET